LNNGEKWVRFAKIVQRPEKRVQSKIGSFDFSSDVMTEIGAFFKKTGKVIVALTVKEILDEQIAHRLV